MGTHSHSYVQSFNGFDDLGDTSLLLLKTQDGTQTNFLERVCHYQKLLGFASAKEGELAAFTWYAFCFPTSFLALVDTYDTIHSGVPLFLCVALALADCGYSARGVRIDSGDLALLSKLTRELFSKTCKAFAPQYEKIFSQFQIVVSNNIDEDTLNSLNAQGHSIDCFGIGTRLVTCTGQGALGCVYKLVELKSEPRIKISEDLAKVCG